MLPTALVTGASRGLGFEFVKQLAQTWHVIAACRDPSSAADLKELQSKNERVQIVQLDVANQEHIAALPGALAGKPIDLLVLNAGIKGSREKQHLGTMEAEDMLEVFAVNTVAPVLIAQALIENVKASTRKQIVCCSSGVGSISENESGGMAQYRMSKAALNMGMQEVAVKTKDAGVQVICMVPGWVQTDMGGPNGRLRVDEAVTKLLQNVILRDDPLPSGGFFDYTGKQWPW